MSVSQSMVTKKNSRRFLMLQTWFLLFFSDIAILFLLYVFPVLLLRTLKADITLIQLLLGLVAFTLAWNMRLFMTAKVSGNWEKMFGGTIPSRFKYIGHTLSITLISIPAVIISFSMIAYLFFLLHFPLGFGSPRVIPDLSMVNKIIVNYDSGSDCTWFNTLSPTNSIRTITDPALLRQLSNYAQVNDDEWMAEFEPWHCPEVTLDYYTNDVNLYDLGVAKTFLTNNRNEYKDTSSEDNEKIINLVKQVFS